MPATPQIPKVVTFTLDEGGGAEDFAPDVIAARVVPAAGAVQSVTTLDGVVHQDVAAETWALELECVQDWDANRPGLAWYLFTHRGEEATFVLDVSEGAISTTLPAIGGTCRLVPLPYGGTGNQYATATVLLPITDAPALDTTP